MKLIDADALINDIEELITEYEEAMRDSEEHPEKYPEDYKTRAMNLIAGLIATKVEVDNAPTIDAEPVKHGEWIEGDMLECNQCHHRMIVGGGAYNFCPNCGARMLRFVEENEVEK